MHEKKLPDEIELVFSFYNTELSNTVSVAHLLLRHYHTELQVWPGCSGQAKFRFKFVKMFRANFGSAYKISSQRWTLWSPVTIEAIELWGEVGDSSQSFSSDTLQGISSE